MPLAPSSSRRRKILKRSNLKCMKSKDESFIETIISQLPINDSSCEVVEYLFLLDKVLEDRRITEDESLSLYKLAHSIGMSKSQIQASHIKYMKDLIRYALIDRVISDSERKDLEDVRRILNIDIDEYNDILNDVTCNVRSVKDVTIEEEDIVCSSFIGKTICFYRRITVQN